MASKRRYPTVIVSAAEERHKRIRELEIIRGLLIAVMTVIATGLVIWILPP